MPANWEYLLQYHHLTDNPKALKAVTATRQYGFCGFMINWVADSPVILQMKTGWCPILKKCFMTMPKLACIVMLTSQQKTI
jgi:hypothetical protein